MTDKPAVVVTDLSASADGSIHVGLEMPAGDVVPGTEEVDETAEADASGAGDPGPDVVAGAAKVAKTVFGTLWDVIKPSE